VRLLKQIIVTVVFVGKNHVMEQINALFKRSIDIALASFGLILLSPVMLVIAAIVKLTSPGNVIYAQTRVGLHRQHFKIYKFRSMVSDADLMGSSVTKYGDERITTVGRFIRRTKLDELPQLWNVLIGDMTLVGPRPDVPRVIDLYTPEMLQILKVRPGVTSIASLYLRNENDLLRLADQPDKAYEKIILPAKVELAMIHVNHPSILLDFRILFQTVWVLIIGKVVVVPEDNFIQKLSQSIIDFNSNQYPTGITSVLKPSSSGSQEL
jgi:lipopolysaccharide/colanic/teichoic acid biosynthesis glycosyltransferase